MKNFKQMKSKLFYFALFFVVALFACNDDDETDSSDCWSNCYDCTASSWSGIYSGECDYYDVSANEYLYNLPATIEIQETAPDYLSVFVNVPNAYSTTISGQLQSNYLISIASSNASFSATLYVKENEFKLSGNSKKFIMGSDSTVYTESITFDIIKSE